MKKKAILNWEELDDRKPGYALVAGVDLVVIRYDDEVSVLYGRCAHRGALMSDGHIDGDNIICGVHGWDYRMDSGISEYNNSETLAKFDAWVEDGRVCVDEDEIAAWAKQHPQPYQRDSYQGNFQDPTGTGDEPHVKFIRKLANDGLSKVGHHGPAAAMGVPRDQLPKWDDLQFVVGQLAKLPLLDEEDVGTEFVIGPNAKKPLKLDIPLFVSDMSFGALSAEAKVALAKGAELAGTGICSGEGGMLPDEQEANSRYFYELASARFGFSWDKVQKTQAFHFKGGQGAKTGTGGHLPGRKGERQDRRSARPARRRAGDLARAFSGLDGDRPSIVTSRPRCASARAASRSASSSRRSTSRRTSMRRSRSASTTSSSTAAAAAPAQRR